MSAPDLDPIADAKTVRRVGLATAVIYSLLTAGVLYFIFRGH